MKLEENLKTLLIALVILFQSPQAYSLWGRVGNKKELLKFDNNSVIQVLQKSGDQLNLQMSPEVDTANFITLHGKSSSPGRRGMFGNQKIQFDLIVNNEKRETIEIIVNPKTANIMSRVELSKPLLKSDIVNATLVLKNDLNLEIYTLSLDE